MSYAQDGSEVRTNTFADGTSSIVTRAADTSTATTLADGTQVSETKAPDPRFGMMQPYAGRTVVALPSGRTSTTTRLKTAVLVDDADPLSVLSLHERTTTNSKTTIRDYDAATRTWLITTPEQRTSSVTVDERGRVVSTSVLNVEPATVSYDAHGRVDFLQQGIRSLHLDYDPVTGYLWKVTDGLTRETMFQRDVVGRPTLVTRADGEPIGFGYDASGNVTGITPPGKPQHGFGYTEVEQVASYMPPPAGGTGITNTYYAYDLDRALDVVTRPDLQQIDYDYQATTGKLSRITLPTGDVATYRYYADTGQLERIWGPYSVDLHYTWDGALLTEVEWIGEVAGSVGWDYNNDFRVASETVNGGDAIAFTYDNDGLLETAGAMTLARDPDNGLLTGSSLGGMSDVVTYDNYASLDMYAATHGGTELYAFDFERDVLGRIIQKTETVEGVTHVYEYGYDLAGRLTEVKKDGLVVEDYDYDANGNRLGGTYDAQDRMLAYGGKTYTYTANGELSSCSDGTQYTYDAMGALRQVELPDGRTIEYVIDSQGRRVGKKVDGLLEWGLLYQGSLRPVAQLDASGAVVSRFVYGTRVNVPEYVLRGGVIYRVVTDHLGSVRMVVDVSSGDVVQRMEYDAYGVVLVDSVEAGWEPLPFGFAGGIYDRDTGLVRFGARDYDAGVGRWTGKDPIGFGYGSIRTEQSVGMLGSWKAGG